MVKGNTLRSRIVGEGEEAPDQLLANPLNWRRHPDAQHKALEGMLREVGWVQRVIVNKTTGHVVDGHLRVELAKRRGEPSVPVIYVELTPEEEKIVLAAIDPIGGLAETDQGMLDTLLQDVTAEDDDLAEFLDSLRGIEVEELEEGLVDDDEVPDLPADPISKPGDVWVLGRHRLMCGDSVNLDDVSTLMQDELADMVWTDPPYNVAVNGMAGKILNDDMTSGAFRDFLRDTYASYAASMREGAVIYVAHSESERAAFTEELVNAGIKLSQVLIWVKQTATLSRQDFNWQHEPIIYGWKEGAGHYYCGDFTNTTVIDDDVDVKKLTREQLVDMVNELRNEARTTVIRQNRPTKSELHPTMKPVALVERMIRWSSRPGEVVLDLFGGSGTTLIAAHKAGRTARIMELDPKFCDVIVQRWQEYTGEKATLETTGEDFERAA